MRWCLDEGDVPALHDVASVWVPDLVRIALLPMAAHLPLPGHGVELFEVLVVHKGSGSDDARRCERSAFLP